MVWIINAIFQESSKPLEMVFETPSAMSLAWQGLSVHCTNLISMECLKRDAGGLEVVLGHVAKI